MIKGIVLNASLKIIIFFLDCLFNLFLFYFILFFWSFQLKKISYSGNL